MGRIFRRAREWVLDAFLFLAIPGVVIGTIGYLLVTASHAGHPAPKKHWNQGPQDPEATE